MRRSWTIPQAAETAGVTYRQLDHWIGLGLITVETPEPGYGVARSIDDTERDVVRWMGQLVRHGMDHGPAAQVARDITHHGRARLGLFTITPCSLRQGAPA